MLDLSDNEFEEYPLISNIVHVEVVDLSNNENATEDYIKKNISCRITFYVLVDTPNEKFDTIIKKMENINYHFSMLERLSGGCKEQIIKIKLVPCQ